MACHELLSAGVPIPPDVERVTLHETFALTTRTADLAARFVAGQLVELPQQTSSAAASLVAELLTTAAEQITSPLTVSVTRSPRTILVALTCGDGHITTANAPDVLHNGDGAVFVVAAFGTNSGTMWFTLPLP